MTKKPSKFEGLFKVVESVQEEPPEMKPVPPTTEAGRGDSVKPKVNRGKQSDPDYLQISAYIRKDTHRQAKRKLLESDSERDLSDVIEELLRDWVSE